MTGRGAGKASVNLVISGWESRVAGARGGGGPPRRSGWEEDSHRAWTTLLGCSPVERLRDMYFWNEARSDEVSRAVRYLIAPAKPLMEARWGWATNSWAWVVTT